MLAVACRFPLCPELTEVVFGEENGQLPVEPFHVVLAVARSAGPVAPYRWEHLHPSDPGFHVRDFVFRVFGSGMYFLFELQEHMGHGIGARKKKKETHGKYRSV